MFKTRLKMCCMIILLILSGNMYAYGGSAPVQYTALYDDTYLTQLATTGSLPSVKFTSFSNNFRILLPPGMRSFFVSMICDNLLTVATVARFGQYPYFTSMPAYLPYGSNFRTENLYNKTGEGSVTIARESYGYSTMPADKAGWLYVDMKTLSGSGSIREITVNMTVDITIFAAWYATNKSLIDCSCALTGTCPTATECWSGNGCTAPVTADFSPTSATTGSAVTFTANTTNATSWSWSSLNSSPSTGSGQTFTTTFSSSGTYNVSLTATGSSVCPAVTKTKSISVSTSSCTATPTSSFTVPSTIAAGTPATFTASLANAGSPTWTAVAKSGTSTSGTASPASYSGTNYTPTFSTAGTYTVTLTATPTGTNCTLAPLSKDVTVNPGTCTPTVTASFETPPTGTLKEGSRITFKNTSQKGTSAATSTDATWLWTVSGFNGQMSFTSATMDLEFFPPDAGTYTVQLTATSGGCSSTYPQATPYSFTVAPYCTDFTASITYPTTTTFKVGDSITFNSGTSASKWIWDFGDGSQNLDTSKAQATHSYGVANSYTVRLTAWDANGCPSTSSAKSIVVTPLCPSASAEYFTTTGKTPVFYVGDAVTFAYSSASGSAISWKISKDGGTFSTMSNPYTFTSVGQYTVQVNWTDTNSCQLTRQMKVEVVSKNSTRDYTSDGKTSLEDAIYVLQVVSDIRQTQ